ncbi:type I toxin-antitoxin system Fst family toxin [Staphylococcus pettenkoferi]|nr:type I toxin-antitoxin system Fst family toxin [Staphylococcus pettenkoferi]
MIESSVLCTILIQTIISSCIVIAFKHWLDKRNKKDDK